MIKINARIKTKYKQIIKTKQRQIKLTRWIMEKVLNVHLKISKTF